MATKQLPKKFVVITMERSGSTMLIKRLASHPEVHAQGELLNPKLSHALTPMQSLKLKMGTPFGATRQNQNLIFNGHNFMPLLDNLVWGKHHGQCLAAGFKIIIGQWTGLSTKLRLEFLKTSNLHVILLHRLDPISHLVSIEQARQHGYKHRSKGAAVQDLPAVHLTLQRLKAFHKESFVLMRLAKSTFADCPIHETSYERLIEEPADENNKLLAFLGVRAYPLTDALVRNSDAPLSSRIENFADFAQSLVGTSYERWLPTNHQQKS